MQNRAYNAKNPNQGDFKRVLCVCSAGLLRSPTAAFVLSQDPYNFNTRCAGAVDTCALVDADPVLVLHWAQLIVCMEERHHQLLLDRYDPDYLPEILVLNIPDNYAYRDPELIRLIKERVDAYLQLMKEITA